MTSNTAVDPGALFGEVRANWGWLIVIAGAIELLQVVKCRGWKGRLWQLLIAVFHITELHWNERLRFLISYLGEDQLTPAVKDLWYRVARAAEAKQRRRSEGRHRGFRGLRARLGLRKPDGTAGSEQPFPEV